jgi:hypothetical protein
MNLYTSDTGEDGSWTFVGKMGPSAKAAQYLGQTTSYVRIEMSGNPASTYPYIRDISWDIPVGASSGDEAAAARRVLDDHRAAQLALELGLHGARHRVGLAAGRVGDHHRHGTAGGLCMQARVGQQRAGAEQGEGLAAREIEGHEGLHGPDQTGGLC